MGSFADYLENEVLDHVFGAAAYSAPATLYVGLSTTTIAEAGTGITEPSGNGYARLAVTNNATNFPAASAGAKSNGVALTFATPSGSWGTVTNFFIADASTGGNILGFGALAASKTIASGDVVTIPAGSLTMSLN